MSKNLHTNDFRLKYLKYKKKYIDLQNKKYGGAAAAPQVDNLWFDYKLAEFFDLYEEDDKQSLFDDIKLADLPKELKQNLDLYWNDLVNLNVTRANYTNLLRLADYIQITDLDRLFDEILIIFNNDYDIIYHINEIINVDYPNAGIQFYKFNSGRLAKFINKGRLIVAVRLWETNRPLCFATYGHLSFWDVSEITDMSRI